MRNNLKNRKKFGLLLGVCLLAGPALSQEADLLIPASAIENIKAVCTTAQSNQTSLETLVRDFSVAPENIDNIAETANSLTADIRNESFQIRMSLRQPGGSFQRTRFEGITVGNQVVQFSFLIQAGPDCTLELMRAVIFDEDGLPGELVHLSGEPPVIDTSELLNPPVPVGSDPGGVAVAHIDTGVNYLLPHISSRLARDNAGTILGWDMFDDDDRPFDGDPGASLLMPRRHGTSVATIILSEAPDVRLVPYRHPGRDFNAFGDLIEDISEGPARIIAMPLGGYREADWRAFATALAAHPELLVVVSAGNNGRDIDAEPVFPASFDTENLLVVTSVDEFGRLSVESNWGAISVDIAVPAEQIDTMDHRGASVRASGASYAVPRIAALAARFAAANPTWSTSDIKSAIIALARPLARQSADKIRYGWLPNPALVGPNPPLR